MSTPHISVIIPVYKVADSLFELAERLTNSLQKITSEYEIILVEDGSLDRSWETVLEVLRFMIRHTPADYVRIASN